MRKKILISALALSTIGFNTAAQENELDPVTVTASLNPLKTSQTGRNLVVIKGEKFAALPVHSIDELLRYIPGIEVQARGPFGSQSDIVLRGGTFQQVLVIVDGVRVNDPNTGHFSSYIPIAPTEIERIEVLKGASSALYGSEAVGGVINIITRTFAAKSPTRKTEAFAQATGGEYELYSINAGINTAGEKTSFSAGILSNNTMGQPQRGIRGFVNGNTISASFGYRFSDRWSLSLRSAYDKRKFAAQNFYTSFVSDTAQETIRTFWNQLQLTRNGVNSTFRIQAGYKNLSDSFAFNPRSATNQNKSTLWQALVTNEMRLSPKTVLTPGVQFISKKIASNDRGNHTVNQAAALLVLSQQFGEHFFVSPAARIEWNERAGWEPVPQLALSYRRTAWQLRGSVGRTIRDADFTERYNNYNKAFVASGRIGNPDLKAENSVSYEAGADHFFNNSFKTSVTFFQRRHNDLIDYVNTPYSEMPRKTNLSPTGTYALARNIAEVTTTGAEADVQYSKTLSANSTVWANLGFVWLRSKTSNGEPSLYLSSHAKYLTNFNVQYSQKSFSLAVSGLYKKRQPQGAASPLIAKVSSDYFVFNAKAEAFVFRKTVSAFVEVDNIGDRVYTDLLGAQMPSRWFMGGIKLFLSK